MGIRYEKYSVTKNELWVWTARDMADGTVWGDRHSMPRTIVSIRAGEYDLDPYKDEADIWDIILNEIHAFSEQAHEKGLEWLHPLYSAMTLEEAREEALGLCRAWKMQFQLRGGPSSGEEMIREIHRDHAIIDPALISHHRSLTKENVQRERRNRMQGVLNQQEVYTSGLVTGV